MKQNKKIIKYILLLMTLFSNLHAEIKCNPYGDQLAMNQCACDEFENANIMLNKTYNELLTLKKKDTPYIKKLKISQEAWLKFRDAEIETIFACESDDMRICWGSMYNYRYCRAMKKLTENRTKMLLSYISK